MTTTEHKKDLAPGEPLLAKGVRMERKFLCSCGHWIITLGEALALLRQTSAANSVDATTGGIGRPDRPASTLEAAERLARRGGMFNLVDTAMPYVKILRVYTAAGTLEFYVREALASNPNPWA